MIPCTNVYDFGVYEKFEPEAKIDGWQVNWNLSRT